MLYLDTSVLVPLFVPEPESAVIRAWFDAHADATFAISDWTITEFSSAMGIKVRSKGLKPEQARKARSLMNKLATESLRVFPPTRSDYERAAKLLDHYLLGLRAGDALHLAVAQNEDVDCLYSLDRRLVEAGRQLKLRTMSPIRSPK